MQVDTMTKADKEAAEVRDFFHSQQHLFTAVRCELMDCLKILTISDWQPRDSAEESVKDNSKLLYPATERGKWQWSCSHGTVRIFMSQSQLDAHNKKVMDMVDKSIVRMLTNLCKQAEDNPLDTDVLPLIIGFITADVVDIIDSRTFWRSVFKLDRFAETADEYLTAGAALHLELRKPAMNSKKACGPRPKERVAVPDPHWRLLLRDGTSNVPTLVLLDAQEKVCSTSPRAAARASVHACVAACTLTYTGCLCMCVCAQLAKALGTIKAHLGEMPSYTYGYNGTTMYSRPNANLHATASLLTNWAAPEPMDEVIGEAVESLRDLRTVSSKVLLASCARSFRMDSDSSDSQSSDSNATESDGEALVEPGNHFLAAHQALELYAPIVAQVPVAPFGGVAPFLP